MLGNVNIFYPHYVQIWVVENGSQVNGPSQNKHRETQSHMHGQFSRQWSEQARLQKVEVSQSKKPTHVKGKHLPIILNVHMSPKV